LPKHVLPIKLKIHVLPTSCVGKTCFFPLLAECGFGGIWRSCQILWDLFWGFLICLIIFVENFCFRDINLPKKVKKNLL